MSFDDTALLFGGVFSLAYMGMMAWEWLSWKLHLWRIARESRKSAARWARIMDGIKS